MGGAIGLGNVTPSAEFNVWADPEAASRVFGSGLELTMVGLDVTHRAMLSDERAEAMRDSGHAGAVVADLHASTGSSTSGSTATATRPCTTPSPSPT